MPRDISELPKELDKVRRAVRRGGTRITKTAARVISREVVRRTPVDTGVARAGWSASVGASQTADGAPKATYPKGSKGGGAGRAETLVYKATIEAMYRAIETFDSTKDRSVIVSNSIDYIGLLNDGSSKQAPANFVELAVQAGLQSIIGAKVIEQKDIVNAGRGGGT